MTACQIGSVLPVRRGLVGDLGVVRIGGKDACRYGFLHFFPCRRRIDVRQQHGHLQLQRGGEFLPGVDIALVDLVGSAHGQRSRVESRDTGIETGQQIVVDRFRIIVFRKRDGAVFRLGVGNITIGGDQQIVRIYLEDIRNDQVVAQRAGILDRGGED